MPRMRSIKPEFWADQDLTRLPRDVRLLYVALWNFADEQARLQGDPRLVKSWCFPLDDDVTTAVVDDWLDVLVSYGKVVRYSVEGSLYLHLPKLPSHQKLDPRLESRLPAPSDDDQPEIDTDESVRTDVENVEPPRLEVAKHVASGREHGAGGASAERDAPPPSPNCAKHPDGTETPCGPCGTARRKYDAWITAAPERKRLEATARTSAINACRHCDADGWLLNDVGDASAFKCDHQQRRTG
jgi:hypothetical protein